MNQPAPTDIIAQTPPATTATAENITTNPEFEGLATQAASAQEFGFGDPQLDGDRASSDAANTVTDAHSGISEQAEMEAAGEAGLGEASASSLGTPVLASEETFDGFASFEPEAAANTFSMLEAGSSSY